MEAFADRLGVGSRQLRRLFNQHLGASPIAVVQTQRLHLAKQLLHDTDLPMAEVALASGFRSLRRFNETFRTLYRRSPSKLRRSGSRRSRPSVSTIDLQLPYRSPYDWPAMLQFLAARAITGVERVSEGSYARTISHEGLAGIIAVAHLPKKQSLRVTVKFPNVGALGSIIARVRRMFDLDADVQAIGHALRRDPLLRRLVDARPGLRVPGGWSGWEVGVRAVLGQQVSLEQGRRLVERLAVGCGAAVDVEDDHLVRVFPGPTQILVGGALAALGVPKQRRASLESLAAAALGDVDCFRAAETTEETVSRLRSISGIGDWTAHYVAMRAAHDPDAFPATDAALRRSYRKHARLSAHGGDLVAHAERWRPWRAYAAQHLWTVDGPIGE
ncbi:MAG: AlkA N-terminal domain-containing protein [Myxococcota bacterium]